jgi:hypothetical protein
VATPIGDQVGDGRDLQAVALGEGDQVVAPGHGAVVVHDLADHARRVEAGQACQVDRRLGVAGAHQDTALPGNQREDMPRRHDIVLALGRVDGHRDAVRAVRGRDARGHAVARLDAQGEGRLVARLVVLRHERQLELGHASRGERQANQPAAVLGHEIDRLGRGHLRRNDQVALVLALLVVDQDEHPAVARLFDDLLDRRQHFAEGHAPGLLLGLCHDLRPFQSGAERSAPAGRFPG